MTTHVGLESVLEMTDAQQNMRKSVVLRNISRTGFFN